MDITNMDFILLKKYASMVVISESVGSMNGKQHGYIVFNFLFTKTQT